MNKNISGVYSIENKINGKKYIGSSKNISYRHGAHFSMLRNNKHPNQPLQNAVNKYGIQNFIFEILEVIEDGKLLFNEQKHINSHKWENLYNTTKIAGSGGGDVRRKKLYIIDLEGNIVKKCSSGVEVAKFLGNKYLEYNTINTKSIKKKKYRIVTPEFYKDNNDIVNSWNSYSCLATYKSKEFQKEKYLAFKDKVVYKSNTIVGLSKHIGITHQRLSQIFLKLKKSDSKKYFHRKSGFHLVIKK